MIDEKYIKLAELLRDMIAESESYTDVTDEVPRSVINMTATALQHAFESGDETPDEEGNLYNIYLINNYGGFIHGFLDTKQEGFDKEKEHLDRIRKFCSSFYKALDADAWGDIEPYIFRCIAKGNEDEDEDVEAMISALKKVID